MVVEEKKANACALNFAAPISIGGGFLNYSSAQEETNCRLSGLYFSLIQKQDFYNYHRKLDTNLASNYIIFTPDCPTWKVGSDTLDNFFLLSFITLAAVNNFNCQTREVIREVHHERIKTILQ